MEACFPSQCCFCKRQIGKGQCHSALQLCSCTVAQCTDCVVATVPSNNRTYEGKFPCPTCGNEISYVYSSSILAHVVSAEELLLCRAFDFFEIRLPRKVSATIDKYKSLLSCFTENLFPIEKQQVVCDAIRNFKGVDSIERLRLFLSRLECLRGGPYLSDFEDQGLSPETQVMDLDGLPLGPLGHLDVPRNIVLDQILQLEPPRLMCDICSTEEVDIALFSCSCAQFCCVPCSLRLSKRSPHPFNDGPGCPLCRAISPRTFIDTKSAEKETKDILTSIITRNSKHRRYKETIDKDLIELCVNYYCASTPQHRDNSYAESLTNYTVDQLQLELVCLSIQQESSLKDLNRELGPLRHISCRTHHFYSVFIRLYKKFKMAKPLKEAIPAAAPGDDLFELLISNVLKVGSIEDQRRQRIENMKMISQKYSMMIEDEELDAEDMKKLLDGCVAPLGFSGFACKSCAFEGLNEVQLRRHESLFHTKSNSRPLDLNQQPVSKKVSTKAGKKIREPKDDDAPIVSVCKEQTKAKKVANTPHVNSSGTFPASSSAIPSHVPPVPAPIPPKSILPIFEDDEDEEIIVPYPNRAAPFGVATVMTKLNQSESDEDIYITTNKQVLSKPQESDSEDIEILVNEKVIGIMREEMESDGDEGKESYRGESSEGIFEHAALNISSKEQPPEISATGKDLYFYEDVDSDEDEDEKDDAESEEGAVEKGSSEVGAETPKTDLQLDSTLASSSLLPADNSVNADQEQLYKYEYANPDDDKYAPVKLDKNLLIRVTERIHQKVPTASSSGNATDLTPIRQSDVSVIDISNNFTIFNKLGLSGQYEMIFQTFRTHNVKGETAPIDLSGSYSLSFYLEMDRNDSRQCYRDAGISRIASEQSGKSLRFKGYIELFTNRFQLVYAAKALLRQFGFEGEIKKFCNWEGQKLNANKLTLASLFVSPRGDDKVPATHPMKQYVCIIRPYSPYSRDTEVYPAYISSALRTDTYAFRHYIDRAVQARANAEKKLKRVFQRKAVHRMTQLDQAKLFQEKKSKLAQGTFQQSESIVESATINRVNQGKSFLADDIDDLDYYRAPVILTSEKLSTPGIPLASNSSVNPKPHSLIPSTHFPTPAAAVAVWSKREMDPYLNIHSSEDEDDGDLNAKPKHKAGVSVVSWVVDTRKENVSVEDAVQSRPRYVYHPSAQEHDEQNRPTFDDHRHFGEVRKTKMDRGERRPEEPSPFQRDFDERIKKQESRERSTSADRADNDRNRDRRSTWERRPEKSNYVQDNGSRSRQYQAPLTDVYDKVGGKFQLPTSTSKTEQSYASSSHGPSVALRPPGSHPFNASRVGITAAPPQPRRADNYFDRASSDKSDSDSADSIRQRKKAKYSSSRPINPNSMLGRSRYYQNMQDGQR